MEAARRLPADVEIFHHGEIDKDPPVLRREPQAATRNLEWFACRYVLAVEVNDALTLVDQTHDRLHGGGLARAIAPHERHHLAAANLETEIVENARGAVPCTQSLDGQHAVRS